MNLLSQSGYPFALVVAVLLLGALFWLLRTQRLREKYSVLWFAVIVGVVLLTFVPAITGWITGLVGVTTPINLVFILAFLVLLVVCIQLSIEISTLEESARTVAEEVALLRLELERRTGGPGQRGGPGRPETRPRSSSDGPDEPSGPSGPSDPEEWVT